MATTSRDGSRRANNLILICGVKNLVVRLWVGLAGWPLMCTSRHIPFSSDALLFLIGQDFGAIMLPFGIGVMSNRDSQGHCTILVSTKNNADPGLAVVAFRTPPTPYEKSRSLGSRGVC
ncbi:hypothetical protein CDL12_00420 [Handroanthus impetiginosus]|uniref:Uncharacterized protein n=1 Tax=Handroanthus impetiginosus TaxID=429701 RepID=A0A2G9IAN4_9LAMI|nr:hypothetical protein CDL12_00420 [Handroanthus impetiginosus]